MGQTFAEDITEFQAANHCTAVSFTLCLKDEDSQEHIRVTISMIYDKEEERPKMGSLKLKFEPEELAEEDRERCRNRSVLSTRWIYQMPSLKHFKHYCDMTWKSTTCNDTELL